MRDVICSYKGWHYMSFGKLLKKLRESRNISQRQLAFGMELRTNSYLCVVEKDEKIQPTFSTLKKLVKSLDKIKPIPKYLLLELVEAAVISRRTKEDQLLFDWAATLRNECVDSGDIDPQLLGIADELGKLDPKAYPEILQMIKVYQKAYQK